MLDTYWKELLATDRSQVWHPYSAMPGKTPVFPVVSAGGVRLRLADGKELIDGMSSWWCAIHGYNHPVLNRVIEDQLIYMSHVMFGGLTHEPGIRLAERLIQITPPGLDVVFFSDSGSVAIEVAIKMAIQYQAARGKPGKQKMVALRGAYHGDTLGAMAVCDPVTSMHQLFTRVLTPHFFAERPRVRFGEEWQSDDVTSLVEVLESHSGEIAAVILEPVVQGAGGMWFYHPEYLRSVRRLCDTNDILLIADEIATGFGRSGKLFACEHAGIGPDILCLGKALTGGYMTLAGTLATMAVSDAISEGDGAFMHGPTFMANPLACAVAGASIELLLSSDWESAVARIEQQLTSGLESCRDFEQVADVRVLGAIGVVELKEPVDMQVILHEFVGRGVWVRPFKNLVYVMPPFVISPEDLSCVTEAIVEVVAGLAG